ncbi:tyrosine-type recombinase/integrase [Sphingomonas sp. R1]|uniref:tyrosine-type recombinase/integrase n=1 Tax=Sphingomonas sp. R1 TaxID=399176 RepID=UPI002225544F|nr:site-specific integrase [Sphingomonas sp. R1]UYY77757.1 tyrosine-type recombinase/integrase [Sphingomonas sp. R1]
MKTRYKNVTIAPDRHGKLRARFRKAGVAPVYMKTLPDQPGFEAEYKALLAGVPSQMETRHAPGSVHDLCTRYYRAADFAAKGTAETRTRRRWLIESFRNEFGNDRVTDFRFEHIEAILMKRTEKQKLKNGRTFGGQVAAVKLRKELLRLFAYAKKLEWISSNPVADAEKVGKERLQGFHTWSEEDIAAYQKHHKLGTKARLALEIILWTGQRRGDARLFGPKHIVNGRINYQAGKTGDNIWMPLATDLRRAIDAMPSVGISTYLVTEFGKPFTKDGFGNKMREWCDEAGLPKCTAHGLRKAIARRMAESRLTDEQIMSVGGWKSSSQVRTYTEAANKRGLADGAIQQIDGLYSTKD